MMSLVGRKVPARLFYSLLLCAAQAMPLFATSAVSAATTDFRAFFVTSPDVSGSAGAVYYHANLKSDAGILCRHAVELPGRLRMLDQEGGRVLRLPSIAVPPSPSDKLDTFAFRVRVNEAARDLSLSCVNMNLAPVADSSSSNTYMTRSRSYSTDPAIAGTFAGIFADSMRSHNVIPTWKHFPGHTGLVRNLNGNHSSSRYFRNRNFEASLCESDWRSIYVASKAFHSASADVIMISQTVYEAISSRPAVLVPIFIEMARQAQPRSLLISDDASELRLADREILDLFRNVDLIMLTQMSDVKRYERVLRSFEQMGMLSANEILMKKQRIDIWRVANSRSL